MQLEENVLIFRLDLSAGTEGSIRYIDLARCMSIVNRKLYRQQGLWEVLAVKAFAHNKVAGATPYTGVPFKYSLRGAPRSWVVRNAMVKVFEKWKDQQKGAYDAMGSDSFKPKWQDFKVYLSDDHVNGTELTPTSGDMFGADDAYNVGSWEHAEFVIEEAMSVPGVITERQPLLHILGPDNGYVNMGIVNAYQESRSIVTSPEPIVPAGGSTNLYTLSEDALGDQDAQVTAEMMGSANRSPPYDPDDYAGGATNAIAPQAYSMGASTTGSTVPRFITSNGFSAVNGLLELQVGLTKAEADVGEFWLQLVIGKRRAY